jgi:hypothetical protein
MTTTTFIPITDRNLPQDRYRKVTILGTIVPRRTRAIRPRLAMRSPVSGGCRWQAAERREFAATTAFLPGTRAPSIIGTGENLAARSGPSARFSFSGRYPQEVDGPSSGDDLITRQLTMRFEPCRTKGNKKKRPAFPPDSLHGTCVTGR